LKGAESPEFGALEDGALEDFLSIALVILSEAKDLCIQPRAGIPVFLMLNDF